MVKNGLKIMKSIRISILFILLFAFIMSCEPPVVFSSSQPEGVAQLTEIPENFRGVYWCDIDSVNLLINDNTIYLRKLFDLAISKQEIDSTTELIYSNGQIIFESNNASFSAVLKRDTVYSKIALKDTLFSTQKSTHILKPLKGHLIVNHKIGDASWEVKIISKSEHGILTISRVDYPENLTLLDTITTVNIVENSYREQIVISPSKAEFGELLDKKIIFGNACQEFKPMNKIKSNN